MARRVWTTEKGLRLVKENADHREAAGNSVDMLFGSGAPPGTSGETDDADIGSTYGNTDNGDQYKKITDTSLAVDWVRSDDGSRNCKQLTGVVAAAQILDSVLVDDVQACEWEIHFKDEAAEANQQFIKINAMHNGESASDATSVDDSAFGKLKRGSNIGHTLLVELSGAGASQVMRLSVAGQVGGVQFTSCRTDIPTTP